MAEAMPEIEKWACPASSEAANLIETAWRGNPWAGTRRSLGPFFMGSASTALTITVSLRALDHDRIALGWRRPTAPRCP